MGSEQLKRYRLWDLRFVAALVGLWLARLLVGAWVWWALQNVAMVHWIEFTLGVVLTIWPLPVIFWLWRRWMVISEPDVPVGKGEK